MFTRAELVNLSLEELRDLTLTQYGLKPLGNPAYKESYITTLLTFPASACKQLELGTGIRRLALVHLENISLALETMGNLTPEQKALIKRVLEGYEGLDLPDNCKARLFALYRIQSHLQAIQEIAVSLE